jgi:signal transduction histidine kinase
VEITVPDDELGELVATFNQMLDRLEAGFHSLKQFTADASHELRSPLTLMRTEVEVALNRARTQEDYERVLTSVKSEVEHLSRIADPGAQHHRRGRLRRRAGRALETLRRGKGHRACG